MTEFCRPYTIKSHQLEFWVSELHNFSWLTTALQYTSNKRTAARRRYLNVFADDKILSITRHPWRRAVPHETSATCEHSTMNKSIFAVFDD
jgi:predicted 3-demethylubiquinone-9 3-methyltransferase (glyoxalase superfamily)